MKFDITRQQLLPSLATLLILVVCMALHLHGAEFDAIQSVDPESILGGVVGEFQSSHPFWAVAITSAIIFYVAISVGRMAAKYALFGEGCTLSVPLIALWMGGVALNSAFLLSSIVVLLFYLAINNLFASVRIDDVTIKLFDGALFMGALPLFYAPSIVVWAILPIVLISLRRTYREAFATVVGLSIAPFAYLYIEWFGGGTFDLAIQKFVATLLCPVVFELPHELPIFEIVVVSVWGLALILGVVFAIVSETPKRVRVRRTTLILLSLAIASTLLFPSFSPMLTLSLGCVCAALLATFTLVRMRGWLSTTLYITLVVLFILALAL